MKRFSPDPGPHFSPVDLSQGPQGRAWLNYAVVCFFCTKDQGLAHVDALQLNYTSNPPFTLCVHAGMCTSQCARGGQRTTLADGSCLSLSFEEGSLCCSLLYIPDSLLMSSWAFPCL